MPGKFITPTLLSDLIGPIRHVNHGFGHGQKGAIGFLMVEP